MLKTKNIPVLFAAILTFAFTLSGCDKIPGLGGGGSSANEVAVVNGFAIIDLDLIARRLGQDKALQQALNQSANQMNQELARQRAAFQQQVVLREQALVKQEEEENKPRSVEQQQELEGFINTLNATMVRNRAAGQQQLNQQQVALIQQFRNKVRPIAISIARERGFSIVLTKNEAVLFAYDEAFDISEEVIRRMATPMVP